VAEMINLGFCAAQFDHRLVGIVGAGRVGFAGRTGVSGGLRLFSLVGGHASSGGDEPACVAAVVLVNVRDDDFLDRFVRNRLDLRQELVVEVFAEVLGVDQND